MSIAKPRTSAVEGETPVHVGPGPAAEPSPPLVSGSLELRLAASDADILAVQALRYRVFYEEMAAQPTVEMRTLARDFDEFDVVCDHLMVFDRGRGTRPEDVIGTYRLLRGEVAARGTGFYTAREYDIGHLLDAVGRPLELGRSCVDDGYRTRPTMQLLWRGIAQYVFRHDISLMFGCASLPGADPDAFAPQLSYLYHYHLAPPALRPTALPDLHVDMNRIALDQLDVRRAAAGLPPLVKGYLRVGGFVGDGAVIDHQFGTTDVCVVVKTDLITERYVRHYERTARQNDE